MYSSSRRPVVSRNGNSSDQPLDGRVVLDRMEGDSRAIERSLPEPAVQEQLARMVLVIAGPLEPVLGLQAGVAHPRVKAG